MAYRDALEKIRTGNIASYNEHAIERKPPRMHVDAFGAWPFVTMWFGPRVTIRRIIQADPSYYVAILAMIVGLTKALIRASSLHLGDKAGLLPILLGCVVIGPIMGLLSIYLGGFSLQRAARIFGSSCEVSHVQAALAWGSLPYGMVLAMFAPNLCWLGVEMFTSLQSTLVSNNSLRVDMLVMHVLDLVMLIWGMVLTLACMREVTRLPWIKLPGVILVGTLLFLILMAFPALVFAFFIKLIPPPTTNMPPPPAIAQARIKKTNVPSTPILHDAFRKTFAKEVTSLLDQGMSLKINGSSVSANPPIERLEITLTGEPAQGKNRFEGINRDNSIARLRILPKTGPIYENIISGSEMLTIAKFPRLKTLTLCGLDFQSAAILNLLACRSLEELDLSDCLLLDPAHLSELEACPALRTLKLNRTKIAADPANPLYRIKTLKVLELASCEWTDEDLAQLSGLSALTELSIEGNPEITGLGLLHLQTIPNLQILNLAATSCTDADILVIARFTSLKSINLNKTGITAEGAKSIRKLLPKTTIVFDGKAIE